MKYSLMQIDGITNSDEFELAMKNIDRSDDAFNGVEDIDFTYDDKTPKSGSVVITYW